MSPPWRRRLSELGRGTGKPHAPLFAPLLYGVASQIEALPPADVTADPTRLGKCLVELRRATGVAPFVVAAPTAMEAEALGAEVDREAWPPRLTAPAAGDVLERSEFDDAWSRSEALAASLETCKRLAATQLDEPVLLAALTGPASLLLELLGDGVVGGAAEYEFAGRALSSLSRLFAQSGASAILLCERVAPADAGAWAAALNTIGNIARFHRIPALLAFDEEVAPVPFPSAAVACPRIGQDTGTDKPHARVVSVDLATWWGLPGNTGEARAIFTAREVDPQTSIETLTEACEAALEIEKEG